MTQKVLRDRLIELEVPSEDVARGRALRKTVSRRALAQLTPFLFVGNNKYELSGIEIGRRLSLTSGRLWVCTAPRAARRNLIGMAWRTLTGHVSEHELNAIEVEEIWVDAATPRISVSTDGEVRLMAAPLHYRIRPAALRVVLPSMND